jgi:hypothetical protein
MKTRFFIVAGTIATALAMAGCKQEAKAPEPVRPVLSAILQPAASDSTVAVGTVQPSAVVPLSPHAPPIPRPEWRPCSRRRR